VRKRGTPEENPTRGWVNSMGEEMEFGGKGSLAFTNGVDYRSVEDKVQKNKNSFLGHHTVNGKNGRYA